MRKLLTLKQAAELLGLTESALTMRVARKQIPHRRWGGRVMFLADELEQFIDTLPGVTLSEAATQSDAVR